MNPYRQAIKQAERTDRELAVLFARYLGSADHPRGRVISTYRNARRSMASAYRQSSMRQKAAALDTVREMQYSLRGIGAEAMPQAVELGQTSAQAQLDAYRKAGVEVTAAAETHDNLALLTGWNAAVDGQVAAIQAMILADAEVEMILGDGDRLGMMQSAPVQREGSRWLVYAVTAALMAWLLGRSGEQPLLGYRITAEGPEAGQRKKVEFQRQAIAAIDERTTDCCLRVHGQIVDLKQKFKLTGTPRFASKMKDPPFHWYCRTSVALYLDDYDDGYTAQMRESARTEIEAREETETRQEIHPAHARSRR